MAQGRKSDNKKTERAGRCGAGVGVFVDNNASCFFWNPKEE